MVKKLLLFILVSCAIVLLNTGCQKELDGTALVKNALKITFVNKAGSADLVLGNPYINPFSEAITFTNFKYYISNISLVTTSGSEIRFADTYYLIDQKIPSSDSIQLTTYGTAFKGIKFLIGVDSARNVSGVQTGALDPANAMFWTWNSGYIMAKMEGTSPVSAAPLGDVTYHIGGFKTGENTVRQISLDLPQNLVLSAGAASEIVIDADAMKWFDGVNQIRIADNAYTATPGALAVSIADNYATMFSVAQVINR